MPPWFRHIRQSWLVRHLAAILAALAAGSAVFTYAAMTRGASGPLGPAPEKILGLLLINLILLLLLSGVVVWKLAVLWLAQRRGSVGSRLQTRIVRMFSLVAIVPTITVAVFSALLFDYGVRSWFNTRVSTALEESVAVAEGYLAEHKENIRADVLAMASDINKQADGLARDPVLFRQVLMTQAALRTLTEAVVFRRSEVLAKTELTFSLLFEMDGLPEDMLERAASGDVVVLTSGDDTRVRALIKLNSFLDTYLLVGRFVDSKVLDHMERARGSADEYQRLKRNLSKLQIRFSVVFIALSLLLLLAALWAGVVFSGELVKPVSRLIAATERVKAGDFDTRVEDRPRNDEIGTLGRAFNRMTEQLQKQRQELVEVNRQTDARRRLIEAVLFGVSAGVIAVDRDTRVTLFNRMAPELLGMAPETLEGKKLADVLPEAMALVEKAASSKEKMVQQEITVMRDGAAAGLGGKRVFLARVVTERFSDQIEGFVVTFDDITELLSAQRRGAWADVARRIAHEVKNPLTPIQLATERLRKKYLPEITTEPETFSRYLDTIALHVKNIGAMIEEFVGFARMPAAVLSRQDLGRALRDAVFTQREAHPGIRFEMNLPDAPLIISADQQQLAQLLLNLLKNAAEAVESRQQARPGDGHITLTAAAADSEVSVTIEDDGPGFPEDLLDRITEPYVTTRDKGTGLGLAIVKKIMDDHGGALKIGNRRDSAGTVTGARVVLTFPEA